MIRQKIWTRAAFFGWIIFIVFLLSFNFFAVGQYSSHPWWYKHDNNDSDATYVAETVTLINGAPLSYLHHPGAFLYTLDALAYRGMALRADDRILLHLGQVSSKREVGLILDRATRISRDLVFVIAVCTAIIIFLLILFCTSHTALAGLLACYIVFTNGFLQHTYNIRPEALSLACVLMAWLVIVRLFKHATLPVWRYIFLFGMTGFLLAASVFSKVQTAPMIVFTFAGLACACIRRYIDLGSEEGLVRFFLILAVLNLVLTPWWALVRPAFLTDEYLRSLGPLSDDARVYGNAPAHFIYPFACFELGLLACGLGISRLRSRGKEILKYFLSLEAILLGAIVCSYVVLVPASVSWPQYIENTHHLVYAVLTNITSDRFLLNKHLGLDTFTEIYMIHERESLLLKWNILWFVAGAAILSIARICRRGTAGKNTYVMVLAMFALGMVMDVLATMRFNFPVYYYAVYSIPLYGIGLALWIVSEFKTIALPAGRYFLLATVSILFTLHLYYTASAILKSPPKTFPLQTSAQEIINVQSHVPLFWSIAGYKL